MKSTTSMNSTWLCACVQVMLAVGSKASTRDIGLERVGVQCDQEWVLLYLTVLISIRSGFDKRLCAAAAGFWWTTRTRPAWIIFMPSDQCSTDAPHPPASRCMLAHCWPVDSAEETASWYSVWKYPIDSYRSVSFWHGDDYCVTPIGFLREFVP